MRDTASSKTIRLERLGRLGKKPLVRSEMQLDHYEKKEEPFSEFFLPLNTYIMEVRVTGDAPPSNAARQMMD